MSGKLSAFVKKRYPDGKADLFACFIERCLQFATERGYVAMITQHSWMFLTSFEKMRQHIFHNDIVNMAHQGARAFEEISGEVVQTVAFVLRRSNILHYYARYLRLVHFGTQAEKQNAFLEGRNIYTVQKSVFSVIPYSELIYWVKPHV
ncbi:MAG: restriction endonuclease, partial [Quinella sp. 1Q5]|nr:restriction endonuclease [Quinella sp. 1Q5]